MKYIIHITTFAEPIRFFAKSTTREEARAEALAFIHAWPLQSRNQPCGLRIEDATLLFADMQLRDERRKIR